MNANRHIRIAERLQQTDIVSLRAHQSRQDDMNEKCGNAQENGRHEYPGNAVLGYFIGEESVRNLICTAVRSQPSVGFQYLVEPSDNLRFIRTWSQRERHVIEATFHVEQWSQCLTAHPKHTESFVVRKDLSAADLVDVFGRQCDAYDMKTFPSAIDDR